MKHTKTLILSVTFSILAAILLFFITWTASANNSSYDFEEKIGIATIFILCCVAGLFFSYRPRLWRHLFLPSKNQQKQDQPCVHRSFHGHHPDCSTFQNHIIRLGKKTRCAGCLGLSIGLILSIVIMIFYSLIKINFTKTIALIFLLGGFCTIALVFLEVRHQWKHASIHVGINSLLPIGFLLIIIGVIEGTGDLIYGFFSLLFCFLWMDTRIQLSKTKHSALCRNCVESCKMFQETV